MLSFPFSINVTSQKTLRLAAVLWHARPYRFRPAGGGFLSHAFLLDLACVARRAFTIQPRKTAFTVVCLKILEALPLGNETKKQMK